MSGEARFVRREAERVLRANWREGTSRDGRPYAYTCPDARKYPHAWLWDSLMHARAWAAIDPARALEELRTLARAQEPDGHIGHTVFWARPVQAMRAPIYNLQRLRDMSTRTIQPPFLGLVWSEVADAVGDERVAAEGRSVVGRHHHWLRRERAAPDGLLDVIQPDETGLDASPVFERALGMRAHGRLGWPLVVIASRRHRFSLRRIRAHGGFTATCPLVNTAWALSHLGLARLGVPAAREEARRITAALVARLWDARAGIFRTAGPDGAWLPGHSWSGLAPLSLPDLPPEVAARLVEEQLADPRRFWPRHPVPSMSMADPGFRRDDVGRLVPRYWQGPSWPFTPPFVIPGLVRRGRADLAE